MPVLVFKGLEGWCDRLQVLGHCWRYCREFDAALCVDWDDAVWGSAEFDFNTCFEVLGVKMMSKPQMLRLVSTGRMDIRPKCWTYKQIAQHLHTETYDDAHIGEFMKFDLVKCEGDVLVTNGKGDRFWHYGDYPEFLRFKPAIMEGIKERLKNFDRNSCVVHLRGTDRPDSKGNYMEKAIEALKEKPYPVYVVTDQRGLWEKFKEAMPRAQLVNPKSNILKLPDTNAYGTHQTDPKILKKYGIKKWDMMLDLLADWVALVSAQSAAGRDESTYFKMARSINALGEDNWCRMFHGWKPPSKSLEEYNASLLLSARKQEEIQQSTGESVPITQDVC